MSNPIMSKNDYFNQQRTPAGYPSMPGYQTGTAGTAQADYGNQAYGAHPQQQAPQQYPQQGYGQGYQHQPYGDPNVAANGERAMTYEDAMMKTGLLLGAAILSGALGWMFLIPSSPTAENIGLAYAVVIGSSLAALVLGFVMAFKRVIGPGLAMGYAVLEGVCLGTLTGLLELMLPGIAIQALVATLSVVGVCWFLHTTGLVKTTAKGMKIVITIALAGLVFSLINIGLVLTGVIDQPWGLRSTEIAGIPLGVILGVLMIVVASYMLINDFENVKIAVANKAPQSFSWTAGIAIVMTVLWIYMEILRLIAILRQD